MAQSHMGTPRSTLPGGHPTVVTEEIAAAAKRRAALMSRKLWGKQSDESQYCNGGTTTKLSYIERN